METREYKVYKFDELSDEQKEKTIEKHSSINIDFEWWDSTYEDASRVQLKLDGFDLDRNRHCTGNFIGYAEDTAKKIMTEHGKNTDTLLTAREFMANRAKLLIQFPEAIVNDGEGGYDENEYDRENEQEDLDTEFLRAILEDYSVILQKEYEYLTSEEAIIETLKANDYDFKEDGSID